MTAEQEKDPLSGVETTGHEWDGLKELNNPAPRWWLWVFVVTVIWSIGYWVVYPAWPTITGATKGSANWTQYKELAAGRSDIEARRAQYAEKFRTATLAEIQNDPALFEFARVWGAANFKENCAACHGTGAAGRKGYPNLNDDDWLWGGTVEDIQKTIKVGVNSGHEEQRGTQMPAFGRDGLLAREQISDVADYVEKLHLGDKAEKTEAYARGEKIFADNCAACHGGGGVGNHQVGAPRLNDEIWLWGGDRNSIVNTVTAAHTGVMPTWENRLSDDAIKALSIYVYSLGGGQETPESQPAPDKK